MHAVHTYTCNERVNKSSNERMCVIVVCVKMMSRVSTSGCGIGSDSGRRGCRWQRPVVLDHKFVELGKDQCFFCLLNALVDVHEINVPDLVHVQPCDGAQGPRCLP